MELTIAERILILNLLPQEGNVVTLRVVRDLQSELGFSDKEMKKLKIVSNPDGTITWPKEKAGVKKNIIFTEARWNIVKGEMEKLERAGRMRLNLISLYERFVEATRVGEEPKKRP